MLPYGLSELLLEVPHLPSLLDDLLLELEAALLDLGYRGDALLDLPLYVLEGPLQLRLFVLAQRELCLEVSEARTERLIVPRGVLGREDLVEVVV